MCCCFVGGVLFTGANRIRSWCSSSDSLSLTILNELDLKSRVTFLYSSRDAEQLWACCANGSICILSLSLKLVATLSNSKQCVTCISSIPTPALPCSSLVWVGRSDGSVDACMRISCFSRTIL
jgi:hypothetical protein